MRMKQLTFLALVCVALIPMDSLGQRQVQAPHLAYVYPAGCQRGMSVEVKVGGQFLQGATGAYFSGQGVEAIVGDYYRPFNQGEANRLRLKLDSAREKLVAQGVKLGPPAKALPVLAKEAGISDEDLSKLEEFRKDWADPKKQPNPQITETVTLQIRVSPDAEPGLRELRLMSPLGLTNPVRFEVGTFSEVYEAQPVNHSPQELGANLPLEVNGRLMPGEVDRYSLKLQKGHRVIVAVGARRLIPYIADAVPGYFQATLALYDSTGKEVAYSDHSESYQDPSMTFVVPESGQYTLEIHDGLYRGREDFVYRLTIGENSSLPMLTLGIPLNSDKFGIDALNTSLFDSLPKVAEREPNNDPNHAHPVSLPCVVSGTIVKPGDVDVYCFKGHGGQRVVSEVLARRAGSPLDSYLGLTDSKGNLLAWNDDFTDKAAGTLTDQADSYLRATLPYDGTYFISVRDAQHKGGQDFTYRLRIRPPEPDFTLLIVPSSVTARAGSTVALTAFAVRHDGFDGDIALSLVGAPAGFALGGRVIPGTVDQISVTLTVPGSPANAPVSLAIEGVSEYRGQQIKRPARAADDMMQAFAYTHLVSEKEMAVAVVGKENRGLGIAPPSQEVKIPLGGGTAYHLAIPRPLLVPRIRLKLINAPEGITLGKVSADAQGLVIELRSDSNKVKPWLRGNVIIEAMVSPLAPKAPNTKANGKPAPAPQPFSLGLLPAIPFTVVSQGH